MANGRLLGIHSGALGDVVLFAQLLAALRRPGATVALAAGAEKAALLAALGVVDEPLDFHGLPIHEVFLDSADASRLSLAERWPRCDRLVSCFATGNALTERALAAACGAGRADFLPVRPAEGDRRHLLEVWADRLGLPPVPPPCWLVPPAMAEGGRRALASAGHASPDRFVAIHPGSGSPGKCWPVECFVALAERLDLPTVVVLGPVEGERMPPAAVGTLRRAGPVVVAPSLADLAGICAAATAFVGNDSGPAHLAAAVGTPTLALFGPTRPANFAPRGRRVRTLHHQPLAQLPVATVAEQLRGILAPST